MKRGWGISFCNYIKMKWSTWVSYSFKAALDYSLRYRSMYFWCHDTTLKKILLIEKLNSTWNKQTNFNKLGLLPRLFQIMLLGRVDGKFTWGGFFCWVVGISQGIILTTWTFSKLKATFCKYWTLIKIKINIICVHKEYEGKIEMVQEQWL